MYEFLRESSELVGYCWLFVLTLNSAVRAHKTLTELAIGGGELGSNVCTLSGQWQVSLVWFINLANQALSNWCYSNCCLCQTR